MDDPQINLARKLQLLTARRDIVLGGGKRFPAASWDILLELFQHSGSSRLHTITSLKRATRITNATMDRHIESLAADGLIAILPDPERLNARLVKIAAPAAEMVRAVLSSHDMSESLRSRPGG